MVYLIVDEIQKVCKIGYAEAPKKRIKQLQTANVNPLILKVTIYGDMNLESTIHNLFKHLRIRGEWFKYEPEILRYFEDIQFKETLTEIGGSHIDGKVIYYMNSSSLPITEESIQFLYTKGIIQKTVIYNPNGINNISFNLHSHIKINN